MKIQKLLIHNMASIEDATIDFSAQPLADSDVFLITGKTGSGKSTILDAICLALYGTTPRLENTNMQGAVGPEGKEVQIDNPAQLIRETSGEMFVRLRFEGTNGIPYEAEWEIHRARKKATGDLQGKTWTLKNLSTDETFVNDRQVKPEIARAIGLPFDQFCRTTMLAQGEFTRFLNSEDKDKASILEKITGVDTYSKIGKLVFDRCKEKKEAYDQVAEKVAGVTLLSDEEKGAINAELESTKKAVTDATASREDMKKKVDWLVVDADLRKRISLAESMLNDKKAEIETEAFLEEKARITSWKETVTVRGDIATEESEKKKERDALQAIGLDEPAFRHIYSGKLYLEKREREIASGLTQVRNILDSQKDELPAIGKAQTIESQLDIIDNAETQIDTLNGEIQTLQKKLADTLNPAKEAAEAAFLEAKKKKDETEVLLKEAESAVKMAGLAEAREEKLRLTGEKGLIGQVQERITAYKTAVENRGNAEKAIEDKKREIEGMNTRRKELGKEVESLRIKADAEKLAYDRVMKETAEDVELIRSSLSVGCTCPVCLQKIEKALPTDEQLKERQKRLKKPYEDAQAAYDGKNVELTKLGAEIKAEERVLSRLRADFERDNSVTQNRQAVIGKLHECGIETFDESTENKLSVRLGAIVVRLSELEGILEAGKALEEAESAEREADRLARQELDGKKEALDKAAGAVIEAEGKKGTKKALSDTHKGALSAAVAAITPLLRKTCWETSWQRDRKAFRESLGQAVSVHDEAETKESELLAEKESVSRTLRTAGSHIDTILEKVPAWRELGVSETEERPALESAANKLKEDILIEQEHAANAREAARKAAGKVTAFLQEHPAYTRDSLLALSAWSQDAIETLVEKHQTLEKKVAGARGVLEELEKQHREHFAKRPDYSEEDTLENLREREKTFDEQSRELSGKLSLILKALEEDEKSRKNLGALKEKADELKKVWEKWSRLDSLIGDATGAKFRKIAQSYVLGSLVAAANGYMKDLTDKRYQLTVVPGTFIISLEDAYQGYAARPASTISGGESFLVSLSLALALSDIGDALAVDTLFIDEGFGTLSGDPLQSAIETLKSLHTKAGRHVGIISHIDELKSKIPVKILVEQSPRTAVSTVKVTSDDDLTTTL